jgi:predicted DNA-binding antitoxin AbrB/MazE fold protein
MGIKLVFHDGVFVPEERCNLPEGSEVELTIETTRVLPPEERKRILKEVVENMRRHPFPENAPRFTREELHERR